jgi:carboxyl-terminal processing protease
MTKTDTRARGQKKPRLWVWFASGFIAVLLIAGIFFAGIQIGNGSWQISFMRPVSANRDLPARLDYTSVNEVYQALKRKYDGKLDEQKLIDGMKKGMVEAAGDPYTTYFNASDAKSFNEQLTGSFSGIGAELGKNGNDIVIISPITGFPAEKAGLKSKDVIVSIDGQDATGLSVDEAVKRIRGEKGTSVKLVVIRDGTQRLEFTIVRDTITIPSVTSKIDNNIGYLQISRFSEDTAGLVDAAAKDFKAKNVKGIVLDLRNNPGGYLNSAVSVSSEWLKTGQIIVQEKRDGKVTQSYAAQADGQLVGVPTVVLINEGSASASEITAGALADNKAAVTMGTKSFGKGSVQEMTTFNSGGMLKVTVARWYTPSGKNIDKEGIEPTIKVELTDQNIKDKVDAQLDAAKQNILNR